MTIHQSKLKRGRVIRETGSSEFAVSKLASISSFFDLPLTEIALDEGRILENPGHMVQTIDDAPSFVRLPDQAKLKIGGNIGAAAPGTAAGLGIEELLQVLFGGKFETPADTVQGAGATTTVIPVTSGAAWEPGSAMGVVISGVVYVREIASISSNNVTLKVALPSAPAADSVIMGCHTFYPSQGHYDSSAALALQALVNTPVSDQTWLCTGMQAESFELTTELGTFAKWAASMMVASATRVSNALADASYDYRHHIIQDSTFRVASVASTTNSATLAAKIDWKINLKYQAIRSAGGVNTIAGYVREHNPNGFATGGFVLPVEDAAYNDLVDAGETSTKQAVTLQIGSIPSQGCTMISAPQVQITKATLEDIEGILGQRVEWVAQRDDDTSGGSVPYLNTAAFRIHVCRITS